MKKYIITIMVLLTAIPVFAAQGNLIRYKADNKVYEGYYISPSEKAPLVFIIHDWDGLTDYEIKRARMLSEQGFSVFAMDLFGVGVRPTETSEKKRLTGELYQDRSKMRTLMNAAYAAAADAGANVSDAVVAGYCFGGAAVLEWARSGYPLGAFVTFHGGLSTPEGQDYTAVKGQVLVFHGSADTAVSLAQFADLAQALETAGIPHEMITYSGAPHAFTVFGSSRYHEKADMESWKRFLSFLKDTHK